MHRRQGAERSPNSGYALPRLSCVLPNHVRTTHHLAKRRTTVAEFDRLLVLFDGLILLSIT